MDSPFEISNNIIQKLVGTDEDIVIPETVIDIGEQVFMDCDFIKTLQIDALLEELQDYCFLRCKKLSRISLPPTLKVIHDGAFDGCKSLTEICLPAGLLTLGNGAFRSCSTLKTITIPVATKSIGASAFRFCKALEKVYIPSSCKKIGKDAFAKCDKVTIVTVQGSAAEKYAADGNLPCLLISKEEMTQQVETSTVRADLFEAMYKRALAHGPAVVTELYGTKVLVRNEINYTDSVYSGGVPHYEPQNEYRSYILNREEIERKMESLIKSDSDAFVAYLRWNEEKMVVASDEEAKHLFDDFSILCEACKNTDFLIKLCSFLPRKKNGSLHVNRKVTIAALPMLYHGLKEYPDITRDSTENLVVKADAENEVVIRTERVDLVTHPEEDYYSYKPTSPALTFSEAVKLAKQYIQQ